MFDNTPQFLLCAFAALTVTACDPETTDDYEQERSAPPADAELEAPSQAPLPAPPLLGQAKVPVADYFIVTQIDFRRCVAPLCGGWFVKRVNAEVTRCADGTWQTQCHMFDLDLSAIGLDPDVESKFADAFGSRQALVRGALVGTDIGALIPADVLVAKEAWLGATGGDPSGHFSRVDDTGIQCVTFPCPYFVERSLNTNLVDSLAGVDLAASGANDSQVSEGLAELDATGLLIAGEHEILSGPAGEMNGLDASEFYSRVLP